MKKPNEELPVELTTAILITEGKKGLEVFFPQKLREGLISKEAAEGLVQATFNQIREWLQEKEAKWERQATTTKHR